MTDPQKTYRDYSVEEEVVNIITHGLGIFLGVAGLILLIAKGWNYRHWPYFLAVSIYGGTFIWTYTTSTLYHSLLKARIRVKNFVHLLDHTAIYLFIAGTYTPIAYYFLPQPWSAAILITIWLFALAGVVFKFHSIGRLNRLSTYLYLAMGWLIVIAAKPLLETAPATLLYWVLAGGISYSLGTVFFLMNNVKYSHGIWHLLVLGGSLCHFYGIYLFI